ncbi:MAG: Gfo/Idh/MocA family protein [Chloroflexota bacterium]
MAGKALGMGVVGLGFGQLAFQLNSEPDSRIEVRGVCVRTESTLQNLQAQHKLPFVTTSFEELLGRDDLDIVGIFTPDFLHASQVEASLRAGKHVVVTKPMALSVEEAERIVRLVDDTGLKLVVGETSRFMPEFMAAKRLLADGDLGEIVFAEAHYLHDIRGVFDDTPWRYQPPYLKDILYGSACHPIDLLLWLLGDAEEAHCYGRRSGLDPRYPQEDTFLANIRFKNGALARLLTSFGVVEPPVPRDGLKLFGTKGTLTEEALVLDKFTGQPVMTLDYRPEPPKAAAALNYGEHIWAFLRYMKHLERCILDGDEPSPGARDGAKVAGVAAACWESVRTGLPVRTRMEF